MCVHCCEWHNMWGGTDAMSYRNTFCKIDYAKCTVEDSMVCNECVGVNSVDYIRRKYKFSFWLSNCVFDDPNDRHAEKAMTYAYRRFTSRDGIAACVVQEAWRYYRATGSLRTSEFVGADY